VCLDPRPTVEVSLKPLGAHGPVGEAMGRKDGERQAAAGAAEARDRFQGAALRIGVAQVMAVTVDGPATTARTGGPRSRELIFSKLNRAVCPKSSRPIKPLSSVLHEPFHTALCDTVQSHVHHSVQSATVS
jgi:hypothetical protein